MSIDINGILRRRKLLDKYTPRCPKCYSEQVQLFAGASSPPAKWKCRRCKMRFTDEPSAFRAAGG